MGLSNVERLREAKINKRIGTILLLLICFAGVGCSYAVQADTTGVEGTAGIEQQHHSLEFTAATCVDNEVGIEVATCDVGLEDSTADGLKDKLNIAIENAYPGYEAHAEFSIKNVGTYSLHIKPVIITNPNPEAISVKAPTWNPPRLNQEMNWTALLPFMSSRMRSRSTPTPSI